MSEFNYYDPGSGVPSWTLVKGAKNSSPEVFAKAWNRIRWIFKSEKADNVLFAFNPVGHAAPIEDNKGQIVKESNPSIKNETLVKNAINAIGAENIDIAGLNVYPESGCDDLKGRASFTQIVNHWKVIYEKAGIGGKPFFIGECNADYSDSIRAEWLREAFEYCKIKDNNVSIFTIFNGCQKGQGATGRVNKYFIEGESYDALREYMH